MPERNRPVTVKAIAVRPPVGQRGRHALHNTAVGRLARAVYESGDPTHSDGLQLEIGKWLKSHAPAQSAVDGIEDFHLFDLIPMLVNCGRQNTSNCALPSCVSVDFGLLSEHNNGAPAPSDSTLFVERCC
jgi:hypothetical protein